MSKSVDLSDSVPPSVSSIPPALESKITSGDSLPIIFELLLNTCSANPKEWLGTTGI